MKGIQFDNAAQRKSYVGTVYAVGTKEVQERILGELPEAFSRLHREGVVHIHDLEAYGQTYNCLQMDVLGSFPFERFEGYSTYRKITAIFDHYRDLVVKLANEQSGGIGFPNFDLELEVLFERLGIDAAENNLQLLQDMIEAFVDWCNRARERCGQTSYYVSLNMGLAVGDVGRFAARALLEYFRDSSLEIIKPNIIFKVKDGVNHLVTDKNRDLFELAVQCTCKKMIPTYLLFDSAPNAAYDPKKVGIMGCRTKVVADVHGEDRSMGRGNIDYVTINLPRIALEIDRDAPGEEDVEKVHRFKERWTEIAEVVKDILLDRYHRILELSPDDFPCNQTYDLWLEALSQGRSLEEVLRHGTFSIGFIGLSDAVQVLLGERYHVSDRSPSAALEIVEHMRQVVDEYRRDLNMNFTLLASSGEYISGRFPVIDRQTFEHALLDKEFYTNSFHVEVDSGLDPFTKLAVEGPFHALCNGGCISYVEFSSAPLANTEAVAEIIQAAVEHGVNYLGVNFPLDRCLDCGTQGTFDSCPGCGSVQIRRIRRVSGYLEDLDYFTIGKKAEVARRTPNAQVEAHRGT